MQALGLIETIGLIAAIESADAMLKAADVNLLERTYVGGGLVSIAVTGDVAAVKAAVDAGGAAVRNINSTLLVSQHVIPRPHEELDDVVISAVPLKDRNNSTVVSVKAQSTLEDPEEKNLPSEDNPKEEDSKQEDLPNEDNPKEEDSKQEDLPNEENLKEEDSKQEDLPNEDNPKEEDSKQEDLPNEDNPNNKEFLSEKMTNYLKMDLTKLNRKYVDKMVLEHGLEKTIEVLSKFKVIELRNLARKYKNFGIKGRSISKADKKLLLIEFRKYYERN